MSKTIDERVVEMRFDNRQFESNVKTSMSTLDKLKQKLNLTGAAKGLENINTATKKVSFNPLASGIDQVQIKFSALSTYADQTMRRITDTVNTAAKNLVNAFTIAPIKSGFQEYETQINAVQTILANTQHEGTNLEQVNKALDELNYYADKTIYNFTEMTRNIGTFTAAGVNLQTSVDSIKGIANLAAVSGSTSQQASTAMYQLSQALAAGKVSLMDWNSVVNAGMGGKVFQDALVRTSELLGTGAKSAIDMYGSFRESLTKGEWLTTEVLTETLKQFAGAYSKADLIQQGFSESQAEEISKMAQTAEDAATKVKTFTQLMDTLKEAAQSGWTQTWEILIGDFEEAKELWSNLSDFFGNVIQKASDTRNAILESAFGRTFTDLADKIKSAAGPIKSVTEPIKETTEALKNLDEIVNKVIRGDFGNGEARVKALTEAGYSYAKVQNKVNEKLGVAFRYSEDVAEAQKKQADKQKNLTTEQKDYIKTLEDMSDAQLKSMGYTDEQIAALHELKDLSEKLGIPLKELINNIDKIDGRWIVLEGLKNIGKSILNVFSAIGNAWRSVFIPISNEAKADKLFDFMAAFHKLSRSIKAFTENKDNVDNITRTFRGLFAAIKIVTNIVGGAFKIVFSLVTSILKVFNLDILDVTAAIGDAIYKFSKFADVGKAVSKVVEFLAPYIRIAADAIKDFFISIKESDSFNNFVNRLRSAGDGFKEWISSIKEADNIPKYLISGFVNGLKNGIGIIVSAVVEIGKSILEALKNVLGIHSPSTETMEMGKNLILGFVEGIIKYSTLIFDAIETVFPKIIDYLKNMDFGSVLAGGTLIATLLTIKRITGVAEKLAAPLKGLGDMFSGIGKAFVGLGKSFKANALEKKSKAFLNIAISLGVLAASIYVLSKIDTKTLWSTIGAIAALGAIIVALSLASSKMGETTSIFKKSVSPVLSMSLALLVMAMTMEKLSKIDGSDVPKVMGLLSAMIIGLSIFAKATNKASGDVDKAGKMLLKVSVALLAMTLVIKLMAKLEPEEVLKGIGVISLVGLVFSALIAVSKLGGEHADKAGKMLTKISIAMLIMVRVIKLASGMSKDEVLRGLAIVSAVGLLFSALILVSNLAKKNGGKVGAMLLLMSGAFLIMTLVIKQISYLDGKSIAKGLGVITLLGALFSALIYVSSAAGKNSVKAGIMLLMMSSALLILTGVLFILSKMDSDGLGKALGVIAVLELLFAGLIKATRFSGDCIKNLIALGVVVGLLIGSVIALTFIDQDKLTASTACVAGIVATFALLVKATGSLANANLKGTILTLATLTIVTGILATILALMSRFDTAASIQNAAALSILITSLAASCTILSRSKKLAKGSIKSAYAMLGIVTVLAGILGVMSALNVEAYINNAISLSVLLNALASSCVVLSKAGKMAKGSLTAAYAMSGVVAILAGILGLMSFFNVEASIQTVIALSVMLNALAASCIVLSKAGELAKGSITAAYAMSGVVAILAAILGIMSALNVEVSIQSAVALSILLNALALSCAILSKAGPTAMMAIPAAYAMSGIVAILAVILGVMAALNLGPTLEIAKSLSLLLLSLSAACLILAAASVVAVVAASGVSALIGIIISLGVLMAAIAGLVTLIPNLETFLNKALPILNLLGQGIGTFVGGIISAVSDSIAASLPNIGTGLSNFMSNASGFIEGAKTVDDNVLNGTKILVGAILALTAANIFETISKFATLGSSFSNLGTELSKFMSNASGFIEGTKSVDPSICDGVKTLADAILVLTAGSFIDGLGKLLGFGDSSLEDFGSKLPALGEGLKKFSNSVEGINAENVTAASTALKVLAEAANEIPNEGGWIAKLTGDNTIDDFGSKLPALGKGIKSFSDAVTGIDNEAIVAAAEALKKLVEIAGEIPNEGGWVSKLTGDNAIDDFGSKLPALGQGLCMFSMWVSGVDTEAVKTASEAIGALVKVAGEIPNEGGWISKITGDNAIDDFGSKLPALGQGLCLFAAWVSGIDNDAVVESTKALKALISAADEIPNSGGWISKLTGDNEIDDFGSKLPALGKGIGDYGKAVSNISSESIDESIVSFKAIVGLAKYLDDNDEYTEVEAFPAELINLAKDLKTYAGCVSEVDTYAIEGSVNAIKKIVGMVEYLGEKDYSSVNALPSNLSTLGSKLKEYSDSVSGIDTGQVINATTSLQKVVYAVQEMKETDFSVIGRFNASLKTISKSSVDNFINAFKNAGTKSLTAGKSFISNLANGIKSGIPELTKITTPIVNNMLKSIKSKLSDFASAGRAIIIKFADGINQTKSSVAMAFTSAIAFAVTSIRSNYLTFYTAGSYLGSGLVLGINSKQTSVYNAGYKLGQLAAQGEKDGQASHSPSKLTIQNGKWLGEGLVIGIEKMHNSVYTAGHRMGETATETISSAVSKIYDAMNTDIDYQPTIRPVMDLSDVKTGANSINSMLDFNPSVRTLSTIGSINTMMNQKVQNGTNGEVVSAINKLRKDLGNIGGTSYNINGVTYDDGSNIKEAIQTIVRAARVERRV